jgi:hypothetical protein
MKIEVTDIKTHPEAQPLKAREKTLKTRTVFFSQLSIGLSTNIDIPVSMKLAVTMDFRPILSIILPRKGVIRIFEMGFRLNIKPISHRSIPLDSAIPG